ncbi:hypothetical protein [Prosthecobacter sp.]|uniref:hypothetical protein n=1 Tax=Prosthecobacter sp. TaxID=1965333 RepID=UPI003782F863
MIASYERRSSLQLLLLCAVAACLCSCRTAKSVIVAVDVRPSAFLTHAKELKEDRKRSPFISNWWTPDKKLLAAAEKCHKIYIAPVTFEHIRPNKNVFAYLEHPNWRRKLKLPSLAKYTQKKFVESFQKAKEPRYTVVDAAARDALTLELSLLEWGPNTYTGIIVREAVDMLTFDFVGEVAMKSTRGFIALEGRLIEPCSQQPVFEFADKEVGKIVVILPLQDFFPSGQAHFAIKEWAAQLEKMLRAKPGEKVSDSIPVVLWNY